MTDKKTKANIITENIDVKFYINEYYKYKVLYLIHIVLLKHRCHHLNSEHKSTKKIRKIPKNGYSF